MYEYETNHPAISFDTIIASICYCALTDWIYKLKSIALTYWNWICFTEFSLSAGASWYQNTFYKTLITNFWLLSGQVLILGYMLQYHSSHTPILSQQPCLGRCPLQDFSCSRIIFLSISRVPTYRTDPSYSVLAQWGDVSSHYSSFSKITCMSILPKVNFSLRNKWLSSTDR